MEGRSTGPSVSPSAQLRPRDTFSCSEECRSADRELSTVICIIKHANLRLFSKPGKTCRIHVAGANKGEGTTLTHQ